MATHRGDCKCPSVNHSCDAERKRILIGEEDSGQRRNTATDRLWRAMQTTILSSCLPMFRGARGYLTKRPLADRSIIGEGIPSSLCAIIDSPPYLTVECLREAPQGGAMIPS